MSLFSASVVLLLLFVSCCHGVRYDNYTLFRGIPMSEEHVVFFKNLTAYESVNFWKYPGRVLSQIDFALSAKDAQVFQEDAALKGIYVTTIIKDIQNAFDLQSIKIYSRRNVDTFGWNDYFGLADIYDWLRDLNAVFPVHTSVLKIGETHENREILAFKLKMNAQPRATVIIEGGIHAREWISTAVVTYIISLLVRSKMYPDERFRKMAEMYEWYFVPVVNPDGYHYTHVKDRMWRKNRHIYPGGIGVDLNRNFGHAFGTQGVSRKARDDTFCGPKEFSELESKALSDFVTSMSDKLEYYIAFHSYGQYMIIPYANTYYHVDNYEQVQSKLEKVAKVIKDKYGTAFTIGTAYDTVGYLSSGVSMCWAKKKFRVPYAVTFELRDKGGNGFALPPKEILPTCEEMMEGMLELLAPGDGKFVKLRHINCQSCSYLDITLLVSYNVVIFFVAR